MKDFCISVRFSGIPDVKKLVYFDEQLFSSYLLNILKHIDVFFEVDLAVNPVAELEVREVDYEV